MQTAKAVRLYEFSALVRYDVVVAAVDEGDAREAISTWEQWPSVAEMREVSDVELTDVRDMPEQTEDMADDLAHEISTKARAYIFSVGVERA